MFKLKPALLFTGIALFGLTPVKNAWSNTVTAVEKQIIDEVDRNFSQQLSFLEKTVNINSGTRNVTGVNEVAKVYRLAFNKLGMKTDLITLPKQVERGNHLTATLINGDSGKLKDIMLIGHMDTVFPKTDEFQHFQRDGNKISGPGVTDMKDGNSIIVYALKALADNNLLDKVNIRVILNSDEESVGRPIEISRKPMVKMAKQSDYALSFESGKQGAVTIARRGNTSWSLDINAKSAHSSGIFSTNTGAGAIFEASRILNSFYGQIRGEAGLTFNPGVIVGGALVETANKPNYYQSYGKVNIVPQKTMIKGDMRFISNQQRDSVKQKMSNIVATHLPHTSSKINFTDGYPAMEETEGNRRLLQIFDHLSQDMGYGAVEAYPAEKRGAGDVSFVADYVDAIDGLGASGGGSHTVREHVNVDSLRMATQRTAIFIHRLSQL